MTNREWVNSLTDEQFVKFMRTFKEDGCSCCSDNVHVNNDGCDINCFDGRVEWLKQEHNFDDWEERDFRYCT